MVTLSELLTEGERSLSNHSETPRTDAEHLLCHAAGCSRATLFTWPDRAIPEPAAAHYRALIERRADGEPVAYLTGSRGFWDLDLAVGPGVLIPRPETELLVEQALVRIPVGATWALADLGTGSGAIALALARERPGCRVVATDRSADALAIARENARRNGIGNIEFRQGRWYDALPADQRFELLLSNPPYIADADPHLGEGDLRFEPRSALASGPDGLDDLRELVEGARERLLPQGWLLVEHGWDQGPAVARLMDLAGLHSVIGYRDYGGHDRVTAGQAPER